MDTETAPRGAQSQRNRRAGASRPERRGDVAGPLPNAFAYTVRDACKATGLGRTTIYGLIAAGRVRAMKAGTRTLIEAESVRRYLASLPTLPTKGA